MHHKIINSKAEDILPTIESDSIDLIVTDPPYLGMNSELYSIPENEYWDWYEQWIKECNRVLKNTGSLYVFMPQMLIPETHLLIRKVFIEKQIISWIKLNMMIRVPQLRNYFPKTEYIGFYVKTEKYTWNRLIKRYGIQESCNFVINPTIYLNSKEGVKHPTQKPLKVIERFIYASSNENDTVLDLFLGSGTTSVCCEKLNRNSVGIECNLEYCELSYERLKDKVRQCKIERDSSLIEKINF